MSCDEYRRWWVDLDPAAEGNPGSSLANHPAECAACRAWLEAEDALDRVLEAALVIAPPPDLSARLARLPAQIDPASGAPVVGGAWEYVVEALILVAVGVSAIGFGSAVYGPLLSLVLDRGSDLLQTIPLILSAPLLGYVENLSVTMTEAMASLLLLAMAIYRLSPAGTPLARTD